LVEEPEEKVSRRQDDAELLVTNVFSCLFFCFTLKVPDIPEKSPIKRDNTDNFAINARLASRECQPRHGAMSPIGVRGDFD
jgi:hypothetical protein